MSSAGSARSCCSMRGRSNRAGFIGSHWSCVKTVFFVNAAVCLLAVGELISMVGDAKCQRNSTNIQGMSSKRVV